MIQHICDEGLTRCVMLPTLLLQSARVLTICYAQLSSAPRDVGGFEVCVLLTRHEFARAHCTAAEQCSHQTSLLPDFFRLYCKLVK